MSRRLLFVVGPTASGKTAIGVELARRLDGEVIGLDSMQIYRGLPILSAVPSLEERAGIEHHLMEELELGSSLDANRFRQLALERVEAVRARGRQPILVGGSGLYVSALIEGLSTLPKADASLRRDLLEQSARGGPGWLHAELGRLDRASALRLHPNDEHRLVRALEVCLLTGRPYSEQLGAKQGLASGDFRLFGIDLPRPALHERIDRRVARMLADGAAHEVARALGLPGRPARSGPAGLQPLANARQMLGIPQLGAFLAGDCALEEAEALLARDTRRFARRQLTWFRRMPGLEWLTITPDEPARAVADRIAQRFARDG